jgi:hypothetical protein
MLGAPSAPERSGVVNLEKEPSMRLCPAPRPPHGRLVSLCIAAALASASTANADAIAGAVFTSTASGDTVNANHYPSKLDVYLNGGPQNCSAPGLPVGQYYYMVTNPSGSVLLSLDPVADRKFAVSGAFGGRITGNLGNVATHPNGLSHCGGISLRAGKDLGDYADTDNGGGVYKLWITRVADFNALCDGSKSCELAAFVHGNTKTDNFKAEGAGPPPPPPEELIGIMEAFKYYDANANGTYEPGTDSPLANWPFTLAPALGPSDATQVTGGSGSVLWVDLPEDFYTVTEGEPDQANWYNSMPSGGAHLDDDTVLTPVSASGEVVGGSTTTLAFGNFCLAASGGLTLGYWSNKNGQKAMEDGGSAAPELALLSSYHLRNANGTDFNPTTYAQYRTWLLAGTATNMAYMLSVQLSAMLMNIESGGVNGNALYLPYGGTINQLVAAAEAALAADGYTPSGDANRATQEQLKTWIDALNNGASVVPTSPCAYSFSDPAPLTAPIAP